MRRTLSVLLGLTFWLTWAGATTIDSSDVEDSVALLSKITGLQPLKKVQKDTITREGVRKFLEEKLKEEVKPEQIRVEELTLKRFGLLPKEFDLKGATVDLITEQAAAFYDFRTKKLYLLEGDDVKMPGGGEDSGKAAQKMIVVHELAHALADQHFDLGKFIKKSRSDDASTARMAVMEGQATWLMMESMVAGLGQSMRTMPSMADLMGASASQAMAAQYPVLAKAPLYMRTSLIFPYNQGLKFQHAVVQKSGTAGFTQVFRQPPVSTQQILHPEKYFAHTEPLKVALPETPKGWKIVSEGTAGELEHSVLLEQYQSKSAAEAISPSWRGGTLALLEPKAKGSVKNALLYASEWEDAASAGKMFKAYCQVIGQKSANVKLEVDSTSSCSGTSDDGPFHVRLSGTRISAVEGVN